MRSNDVLTKNDVNSETQKFVYVQIVPPSVANFLSLNHYIKQMKLVQQLHFDKQGN